MRQRIALLGPANSIHLQRWAAALAERGHPLCVLTQHPVDRARLPAAADVIELPHHGQAGYFLNAFALRRALRAWRPDLLNAHYASGYGTTAAFVGGVPTLLSVWGSDVYDFPFESRPKGWLLRRNLRRATAVASTSVAMAAQVRRLTPERDAVEVTPFGVDLDRFAPRAEPRAVGAPLTIGIVKTLAPKYGVDLLLRAFAGLSTESALAGVPDDAQAPARSGDAALPAALRLTIVGDGPDRSALESLAARLGVADRVDFIGAVDHADVPGWLQRFDIFAAPSRLDSESFGVAAIEAGAAGLPVVVSDAGGLPEVVRDGVTGLVVPREDVGALRAALSRLLRDAGLRRRLGVQARAHVAAEYDWERCVDRMETAYRRTVELARASSTRGARIADATSPNDAPRPTPTAASRPKHDIDRDDR